MSVANYEFRSKPFVALTTMNAGIPDSHKVYWESTSVHDLYSLSLSASPQKVLEKIQEPMFTTGLLTELNRVYENKASTSFTDALMNSSDLEKKGKKDKRREGQITR